MSTTLSTDEFLLDLLNESVEVLEFQNESASINNPHENALLLDIEIESGDIEDLSDDDEPSLIINQQSNLHLQLDDLKDDHDKNECTWPCSDVQKTNELSTTPTPTPKTHFLPPLHENIITETTNTEVIYLRATSKSSNEDKIGDLGNLSDFTDQEDNCNIDISHPKTAKEEIIFVAIEDKTAYDMTTHITTRSISNFIDITPHINHIDLQQSIFNILCHDTDMDSSSDHDHNEAKMDSDDSTCTPCSPDINIDHNTNNNKILSAFTPDTFDICLLTSAPLNIESQCNDECSLEYLHHALPNRSEIQEMVCNKLIDSDLHLQLRYAHLSLTKNNIQRMVSLGGCKILQMVGLCCNPVLDMDTYPQICNLCPYKSDNNYILLQTSDYGDSKWYNIHEIYDIINVLTVHIDIIICISPQHQRMVSIFKTFGFNYIIGVESPLDYYTFAKTEQYTFLSHFYYGLLNKGSVSHCFYLSLQAANPDSDHRKYILDIDKKYKQQRFVIFNEVKYGEIMNLSAQYSNTCTDSSLPVNTNLLESIRPFIGRSQSVIQLLQELKSNRNKIINITGRELIGKSTLIKYVVRYLSENGLFSGGCFMIDCKTKKYKNCKMSFSRVIYDVICSCRCDLKAENKENDVDVLLDDIRNSFCFIVLNINQWYKGPHIITKWIMKYAQKLFKNNNSRIICTNNKILRISPSIPVCNMSELTDLNRNELAMIFKYFCGDLSNFNLTLKDIEEHDALQCVFNGSPGITQKVAQFVMFSNHGNDKKEISLDQIARDYKGTRPRPMYLKCSISAPPNALLNTNSNGQHLELDRSVSLSIRPSEEYEDDPYALISDPSLPPSPQQNVTYRSMPKSHSVEKMMASSTKVTQPRNLNESLELIIHSNPILLFSDINDTDFLAKQVWNISCAHAHNSQSSVTLTDLYPHLMAIFQRLTDNKSVRQPKICELTPFFIKTGGVYSDDNLYITQDKFYRFFIWFYSMCTILKDLDLVYNHEYKCDKSEDKYMSLFYSRDTAKQHIKKQIEGTFVFRVASQVNGLAITFKKINGKISNILLKRLSNRIYTVGKTQKKTNLFQLISSWSKLKYLFFCDTYQIGKELIFHPNNSNIPSLNMRQSFTQHTHSDIYADIDVKVNSNDMNNFVIPEIDEIVRNFSSIYVHDSEDDLKHENEDLKKENMDLKTEMERIKNENERLKQLLLCRYSVNTPSINTPTPTSISISSFSSESISPVTPAQFDFIPFQQNELRQIPPQFVQKIPKYPYDLLPFKPQ